MKPSTLTAAWSTEFKDDERGGIAIIFALMLTAITLMVGLGIDVSRMMLARTVVQQAVDAASLAGAKMLVSEGGSGTAVADAKLAALNMYKANIQAVGNLAASLPDPVITPDPLTNSVVVNAIVPVQMAFMGLSGISNVNVGAASTSSLDQKDIEVGMALDITGSMDQYAPGDPVKKIDGLKAAFKKFAETLVPAYPQSGHKVRVGIAPFAATVNLGSYANAASNFRSTDKCVNERLPSSFPYTYSDLTPQSGGYYSVAADGVSGAYVCPTAAVLPMTDDRNALITKVNSFKAAGSTAGHLGAQWAWNLISEDYGSFWGGNSVPAAYSETLGAKPKLMKAVILMTDGAFNTAYHNTNSSAQALKLCEAMKARGVVVFTIGFGLGTDIASKKTLQDCASTGPEFFADASNANDLDAALQQFASVIGKLRVSK
jgi:Flp pilus assembly protein TadG